jgi:acetyl-CoA synthase
MSTELNKIILQGAGSLVAKTGQALEKAVAAKGRDQSFEFPDTAYYLPIIYALTGLPVQTLGDMDAAFGRAKELLSEIEKRHPGAPTLGDAAEAGLASLLAAELLLALDTLQEQETGANQGEGYVFQGFIPDTIMRTLGVQLVDGTIPGIAALIGAAPDDETAVKVVRELQEKGILTLIAGRGTGNSIADQLLRAGVEFGWESRIVVLGPEAIHALYAISWAIRASLIYGGIKPGSMIEHLTFQRERVPAFVIAMGAPDAELLALGAGAIAFGFPVISDQDVPTIVAEGVCPNEALVGIPDYEKLVRRAIEVRNLKIIVSKPPVPVPYGPAFEGERVRKENTFLEFGGQRSPAFEWLRTLGMDEIEDNRVIVVGKDWQERIRRGGILPLGMVVEVAGRKMQKDFEGVIERKLHSNINEAHGVWYMGQRDIVWARISNEANQAGFTLEHFGVIQAAMIHNRFGAIVDKVQVTLYIDEEDVIRMRSEAREAYLERDRRMGDLTDESVDTFFSCLLCQSFAPNHVCVISPERLGLCGAYNWLDAKAAFEIDPTGGNQPILKGKVLDEKYGRYAGIDGYLKKASRDTIETLNMYTIMENPMTSCGCFECIVAIVPEANGVMIVHRGFTGMTPVGMKFSTLAASVGGGVQTPGFMGIGINFITSPKFILGDGGIRRIVWMTTEIKERIRDAFIKRAAAAGIPDLLDRIADETICEDGEKLVEYMASVAHPAFVMSSLLG